MHRSRPVLPRKDGGIESLKRGKPTLNITPRLQTKLDYCENLVKQSNPEQFTCGLFMPTPLHQHAFNTIYALNLEIARIKDVANNYNAAALRMNWWRQTVKDSIAGTPPEQPVAEALAAIARTFTLRERHFKPLLDWRAQCDSVVALELASASWSEKTDSLYDHYWVAWERFCLRGRSRRAFMSPHGIVVSGISVDEVMALGRCKSRDVFERFYNRSSVRIVLAAVRLVRWMRILRR